jgi:hypothetical protein
MSAAIRARGRRWTAAERFTLDDLLDQGRSDRAIARRLGRSPVAIHHARWRHGLAARHRRPQRYTASAVARLLGYGDSHGRVTRWIRAGALRTQRQRPRYGPQPCFLIAELDLYDFLADPRNWCRYDPATIVDAELRAWLLQLRRDVRFLSVKEAARAIGCHPHTVVNVAARAGVTLERDGRAIWVRESDVGRLRAALRR